MLPGVAQVRINQKRAFAQLREDDRQIGRQVTAALAPGCANDGQYLALFGFVEPAHHELAANCSQLINQRAERLISGDQLSTQGLLLIHRAQVGIGKLPGQRELDVRLGQYPKCDGRIAKPQVFFFLKQQDALGIFRGQKPRIHQDGPDGTVGP